MRVVAAAAVLLQGLAATAAAEGTAAAFPLGVSKDRTHLVDASSAPFLVAGDTAWSLIAQLGEEDIAFYLDDRARRGFNSIIVNLIEHKFATRAPATKAGLEPFSKPGDFSQPNAAYLDFAHRAVEAAAKRGICVWLCPAYLGWDGGDEGFFREIRAAGPAALREFGKLTGARFKDLPNVVWMIGGDFSPPEADRWTGVKLVEGLREGGAAQLITAHGGQTSGADTFGEQPWLDVDTVYSYKPEIHEVLRGTAGRGPRRPFVLIETTYEGEHDSTPAQIRRQAWWAMLCGSCGQFFGNNPIWHFDGPTLFPFRGTWRDALDGAGSRDMARLAAFFAMRRWQDLLPNVDRKIVAGALREGASAVTAARTADGKLAVVYVASSGREPREVVLDLSLLRGPLAAAWHNPAKDEAPRKLDGRVANRDRQSLSTPGDNGAGANDWVLVLEAE